MRSWRSLDLSDSMKNELFINPAYEIRKGESDCGHKTEKITLNGTVYEFCDVCMVCWVQSQNQRGD